MSKTTATFHSSTASELNKKAARGLASTSAAHLEARGWLLGQGFYSMSRRFQKRTGWAWHAIIGGEYAWARITDCGSIAVVEILTGAAR